MSVEGFFRSFEGLAVEALLEPKEEVCQGEKILGKAGDTIRRVSTLLRLAEQEHEAFCGEEDPSPLEHFSMSLKEDALQDLLAMAILDQFGSSAQDNAAFKVRKGWWVTLSFVEDTDPFDCFPMEVDPRELQLTHRN